MALLKMLSRKIPYIEIVSDAFCLTPEGAYINITGSSGIQERNDYPHSHENMIRIGYDYGAKYRQHIIDCRTSSFIIHALLPKPNAAARAKLDLALLESEEKLPKTITLSKLAKFFDVDQETMAASLNRVNIALNERLDVEYLCTEKNPFPQALLRRRLSLLKNPLDMDPSIFYRRLSIRIC
jgi:hypothetical protein